MRTMMMAMLATLALAGTVQAVELNVNKIPYERLSEEISQEGETLEAFLVRVGPKLRAYSNETSLEACGAIASNGTQYGLIIGTSGSHLACAIFANKVPEGMTNIGAGIHSHGGKAQFRANRADRLFMGLGDDARTAANAKIYGQELNRFSETDHRNGAGYLATETGVIYYDGKGNTTAVVAKTEASSVAMAE